MRKFKRSMAFLLSFIMLGTAAIAAIPASAASIDIDSASDFNAISNGGNYRLTADITISATLPDTENIIFDGNGHSITLSSTMGSGAFRKLKNSTIKNLTVKAEGGNEMTFKAEVGAGTAGVVGTIEGCTLENVTNAVSITVSSGTAWFGGVAGNVYSSTLTNCTNTGNITALGGEYTGGIAGVNFNTATYSGCKNYGNIHSVKGTTLNCAGGIIGYIFSASSAVELINCVSVGNVTAEGGDETIGAFAGRNDGVSCVKKMENCYNFTSAAGFGLNPVAPDNASALSISKASDLLSLKAGNVYTVTANFECAGGYTLPIGALIEGNGHTITLKDATSGLFKASEDTIIQNLTLAGTINSTADGNGAIGALINSANGSLVLKNITNNASINISGKGYSAVGGIVGEIVDGDALLSSCNNIANITASSISAGGIVGKVSESAAAVKLSNSNNLGGCASSSTPAISGICGINEIGTALTLSNCNDYSNDATIKAIDIKLNDEISMRFYIGEAVFAGADEVSVKANDKDAVLLDETAVINGINCRIYSVFGISPKDFGKAVEFSVTVKKNGETYSDSKEYSVKDYCMAKITDENTDDALKKLCVDMLNYGAEAQKAAGDEGALVNEELSTAQKKLGTLEVPTVTKKNTFNDASIAFENEINPVFKFTSPNGIDGVVAEVSCGNDKLTVTSFTSFGDNVYGFKLDGLSAANFKNTITVKVNGEEFSFSIEAYANDLIKSGKNAALAEAALKYINSVELYLHDVTKYELEKYATPVWEGNIVYAETAFIREEEKDDPYIAPIKLLYPIDEVISIRSADMKTLYREGVDYEVIDGMLFIKTAEEGGHIKALPYYSPDHSKEAFTYPVSGTYAGEDMKKGDIYYYWRDPMFTNDTEGGIVKWTVSVTYKHSGKSIITTPKDQSAKLEGLADKLVSGNKINVVSLGDSITYGCSASLNFPHGAFGPKSPAYNQMFCDYLEAAYGVEATHKNLAVGGTTSEWGAADAQINSVCNADPDIFILAFGMNDGGMAVDTHVANINKIVSKVLNECPDAYIIVVSTCLLGQGYSASNQNRLYFGNALETAFKDTERVVVANVTNVDIEMQGYDVENETDHQGPKCYQDLTGSNSNHPNDFMHRVYLQIIVQTVFGENKFSK